MEGLAHGDHNLELDEVRERRERYAVVVVVVIVTVGTGTKRRQRSSKASTIPRDVLQGIETFSLRGEGKREGEGFEKGSGRSIIIEAGFGGGRGLSEGEFGPEGE